MTIKPEILYVAHRIPYPPNKGDKIRSFNEIRYLSRQFVIDLVCLADDSGDISHVPALKKYCRRVVVFPLKPLIGKVKGLFSLMVGRSISEGYFYHLGMAARIKHLLKRHSYRAVLCFSSPMARYFESMKVFSAENPKLIMDFCDLDSDKWKQYALTAAFPLSWIYQMEARRLLAFEKRLTVGLMPVFLSRIRKAYCLKHCFPKLVMWCPFPTEWMWIILIPIYVKILKILNSETSIGA